jgi:hypothetical protein
MAMVQQYICYQNDKSLQQQYLNKQTNKQVKQYTTHSTALLPRQFFIKYDISYDTDRLRSWIYQPWANHAEGRNTVVPVLTHAPSLEDACGRWSTARHLRLSRWVISLMAQLFYLLYPFKRGLNGPWSQPVWTMWCPCWVLNPSPEPNNYNDWATQTLKSENVFKIYFQPRHVVGLYWVPGHTGVRGNEMAYELARGGSGLGFLGPEPALGVSRWDIRKRLSRCLINL